MALRSLIAMPAAPKVAWWILPFGDWARRPRVMNGRSDDAGGELLEERAAFDGVRGGRMANW